MSTIQISPEVERGSAWLDRNLPGWRDDIDLALLDLKFGTRCIIGQLYGSWGRGMMLIGRRTTGEFYTWSQQHGFYGDDYPRLTAEWRYVITGREMKKPSLVSTVASIS